MSDTSKQLITEEKLSNTMDPIPDPDDIKDNGAAHDDESTPPKRAKLNNDVNDANDSIVRKGRGSRGEKRKTLLEKTAQEGEALLKTLGHKTDEDDPDSNRRRTRSQTRGTPAPPPPVKKMTPKIPKSPEKNDSTGTPKRRGRPPKNIPVNSVENNASDDNAKGDNKKNKTDAIVANDNDNDDDDSISDEHKIESPDETGDALEKNTILENNEEQTVQSSESSETKPKSNSDTSNSNAPPIEAN